MKTLVAIPCLDMMQTPFVRSLVGMNLSGDAVEYHFGMNSLVYDARNQMAEKAVRLGFDRVLWIDSDMVFQPDLMTRLMKHLDDGMPFCCGLFTTRKPPIIPCIYKRIDERGPHGPIAESMEDYPKDSVFEVAGSGFGAVMMETSVIRAVMNSFGWPFSPILGFGEDLSFCYRAGKLGIKMYCDSSIKIGHVGYTIFDESAIKREGKE